MILVEVLGLGLASRFPYLNREYVTLPTANTTMTDIVVAKQIVLFTKLQSLLLGHLKE